MVHKSHGEQLQHVSITCTIQLPLHTSIYFVSTSLRSDTERLSFSVSFCKPDGSANQACRILSFVEPNVPRVMRQLYAVMFGTGGNFRDHVDSWCDISQDDSVRPWPQVTQKLADWDHFQPIFDVLRRPRNRPFALAAMFADRWRRRVKSGRETRRRALERTHAIKEELMAAAWHPRRMVDWCMDTEEQDELRSMIDY